jgi:hypothetical protein
LSGSFFDCFKVSVRKPGRADISSDPQSPVEVTLQSQHATRGQRRIIHSQGSTSIELRKACFSAKPH